VLKHSPFDSCFRHARILGHDPTQATQGTLWEGVVAEDARAFWDAWMVEPDRLLDEEELIDRVYEAQSERTFLRKLAFSDLPRSLLMTRHGSNCRLSLPLFD
jgi:hypothetical protein